MKFFKISLILSTVLTLASCSSSVMSDEPEISDGKTIRITGVSQTGFVSESGSRTTYTDSYATVFEEGDRLGLILVGADGRQIANVPFSYTADGTWNNDRSQLYLPEVKNIVAYFPYNENLPAEVCDRASLKNSVKVATDQSDRSAFTSSDLLVCELPAPGADLNITFSHAFSMLRFSPKAKVSAGDREFEYSVALEGLKINIGTDIYSPCFINEGYVMIVRDETLLQPEVFKYTYRRFGEDRATKTLGKAVTTGAGTVFSFPCPPAGSGEVSLTAGDYYCVTENDGMVVVIPAGASAIPQGLICQGIVFKVMDDASFATFASDNGLTAADYKGINGRHGLIVSLKQGGILLTGYNAGDVANNEFLKSVFAGFEASGDTEVSQGYKLTRMLSQAYGQGNAGVTFTGLDGFSLPLAFCTNWYIPSFNELKYLIRGAETANTVSLAGQEMINARLTVVSGTLIEGNMPSVSYKQNDGFCIMQNGEEMGWHGVPDGEKCRPICAF